MRVLHVPVTLADMSVAKTVREQHLDGLADQLGTGIAENGFDLPIDDHDQAAPIHDQDRVWRGFQQPAEQLFGYHAADQPSTRRTWRKTARSSRAAISSTCVVLSLARIALDVDTPEDLCRMAQAPGEKPSQLLARELGFLRSEDDVVAGRGPLAPGPVPNKA